MKRNEEVEKLFKGVIPERVTEVMDMVYKYNTQFRIVGDKSGFNLDGGCFGTVQYTQRSLNQLWLFGYAGMCSLHCYSSVIAICRSYKINFDLEKINNLPEQKIEDDKFSNTVELIQKLSSVDSEYDFEWPSYIPNPENGKPRGVELEAVFDLTIMATAYVFLHELKHVIFQIEGNAPEKMVDEELACDAFATGMMLDKIAEYSDSSGYEEELVRMKRSMSIALASVFLLLATPFKLLAGTATHPPVHNRWSATLNSINLPEDDYIWLYFSSLAIALMKYLSIDIPVQPVINFKSFSVELIECLENAI